MPSKEYLEARKMYREKGYAATFAPKKKQDSTIPFDVKGLKSTPLSSFGQGILGESATPRTDFFTHRKLDMESIRNKPISAYGEGVLDQIRNRDIVTRTEPAPVEARTVNADALRMPTMWERFESKFRPVEAGVEGFRRTTGTNIFFEPTSQQLEIQRKMNQLSNLGKEVPKAPSVEDVKKMRKVHTEQLEQEYPKETFLGESAGNVAGWYGGKTALGKVAKLAKPGSKVAQAIQKSKPFLEGAIPGYMEGRGRDESQMESLKRAGLYGLLDVATSRILPAAGRSVQSNLTEKFVAPELQSPRQFYNEYFGDVAPKFDSPRQTYDDILSELTRDSVPQQKLLPGSNQKLLPAAAIPAQPVPLKPRQMGSRTPAQIKRLEGKSILGELDRTKTIESDIPGLKLDEARSDITRRALSSLNEANTLDVNTISSLRRELKQSMTDMEQDIANQIKEYKSRGIEQGSLKKDAMGNVIGRTGRTSNNDLWYREISKDMNYKKLTAADREKYAKKILNEGIGDWDKSPQYVEMKKFADDLDDIIPRVKVGAQKEFTPTKNISDLKPSAAKEKIAQRLKIEKQAKLLPKKPQFEQVQPKFRRETPFTATKSEIVDSAKINRLSDRAKIEFPDYDNIKTPKEKINPIEGNLMRDLDFDNITSTNQLPSDEFNLASYLKTAQERKRRGLGIDLQLFSEAEKKLVEVRELRGIGEIGRKKERGFSINSKTDLNNPESLRNAVDESPFEYNQQSHKELEKEANRIMEDGFDNALTRFYETINDIDRTENVPLAKLLAREASNRGDDKMAVKILSDMAERLTFAGRLSSAAKVLRDATPQTYEATVRKLIKRLNELGRKEFNGKFFRKNRWNDIDIPEDITKEILSTKEFNEKIVEEFNQKIYEHINKNIPVKFTEKFNAWRRFAMLFNPTTHIRNVVGNTFMNMARKTKDALASVMENALPKEQRTKAIGWSRDKDLAKAVDEYYMSKKTELENGGRWDINPMLAFDKALSKGYIAAGERDIFKKGLATKAFEKLRGKESKRGIMESLNKLSRDVLSAEDNFFVKRVYKDSLGQVMKARGLKEITEEAHKHAMQEAYEATFKLDYDLVTWINKQKRKRVVGQMVESQIPFTKSPVNIFMRALEYSPLGLIKALYDVSAGKSASHVINSLAKGMTGTGIATLGYLLADMGWARGKAALTSKEEELMRATGEQAYSIETPLGSYTIDWAQPIATPFFMGVIANESLRDAKNGDFVADRLYDAIAEGTNTLFDQSFVRNLGQILRSGKPFQELAEYPLDLFEQSIPALMGKTSRAIDPYRRETFAETPIEGLKKRTISKTPWSQSLEPKLDIFGQEESGGGFVQQFLSAGYAKAKKSNIVTDELMRLRNESKTKEDKSLFSDAIPKMVDKRGLEPKQVTEIQRMQGKNNFNDLQKLFKSNLYKNAKRDLKLKAISSIVDENYKDAKDEVLGKKKLTAKEKREKKKMNKRLSKLKKVVGG